MNSGRTRMQNYIKSLFLVALLGQSVNTYAVAQESYLNRVGDKLAVGSANVALGWLEIPKNMIVTTNEYNVVMGITGGVLKGVLHTIGRTLCGTFDLVTFPLPSQSIVKPAYVYENFKVETQYGPIPF